MKLKIIKKSGLEESSLIDYSGLKIRVSTTARLAIRNSDKYKSSDPMSNPELNSFLAGIFKNSGGEEHAVHYFLLRGTTKDDPDEVASHQGGNYVLRGNGICFVPYLCEFV